MPCGVYDCMTIGAGVIWLDSCQVQDSSPSKHMLNLTLSLSMNGAILTPLAAFPARKRPRQRSLHPAWASSDCTGDWAASSATI